MRKLLGVLMCASACMVLGMGASGCTKKKTEETKVTKTEATDKGGTKTETTTVKKTETEPSKKFTLKAADVTVTQGETAKVTVHLTRDKFGDPVDVSFTGLPDGVTVADDTKMIAKDATSADFTLKASPDAKIVDNHKVTVWGSAGGATKQEDSFMVSVKKK